ncbi:hypothetical protein NL676_021268 [Syzygium grande]|nr:hypothetical protein NL676_021268 [Syzygium grande]
MGTLIDALLPEELLPRTLLAKFPYSSSRFGSVTPTTLVDPADGNRARYFLSSCSEIGNRPYKSGTVGPSSFQKNAPVFLIRAERPRALRAATKLYVRSAEMAYPVAALAPTPPASPFSAGAGAARLLRRLGLLGGGGRRGAAFPRRPLSGAPGRRLRRGQFEPGARAKLGEESALEYRKLGDSDLVISEITLGTVRFRHLALDCLADLCWDCRVYNDVPFCSKFSSSWCWFLNFDARCA